MIFSAKLRLFHQIRNKFSTYRTYLENFYLLRCLLLCFWYLAVGVYRMSFLFLHVSHMSWNSIFKGFAGFA